jgi:cell wall-associated NlpC family hydrolase
MVVSIARDWLGTPYHHHARIRGVGVDCVQLLLAVYPLAGVCDMIDTGTYDQQWHLHQDGEMYRDRLLIAGWRMIDVPALGDIALYRFGRAYSHAGIVSTDAGDVIHAYAGRGVIITQPGEPPLCGRKTTYWTT